MRVLDLESIRIKIAEITRQIVAEYDPEKIILFGSLAWGKPGPDSDVDLLIIKNTKQDFFERSLAIRRIVNGAFPMDILVRTPEEIKRRLTLGDSFYINIIKNGKQLYGKQ